VNPCGVPLPATVARAEGWLLRGLLRLLRLLRGLLRLLRGLLRLSGSCRPARSYPRRLAGVQSSGGQDSGGRNSGVLNSVLDTGVLSGVQHVYPEVKTPARDSGGRACCKHADNP
jgi:hypothetical protein